MTSGGARARSGPAPDPSALRRTRDAKEWVKLARDGREGKATPEWPLRPPAGAAAYTELLEARVTDLRGQWAEAEDKRTATALAKRLEKAEEQLTLFVAEEAARERLEMELWTRLWTYPQAVVWEADFQHLNVAMYTRAFLEASRPEAKAANRVLVRQYADILLLTEPSLHAHKYVIDAEIGGASDPDLVATRAGMNPATTESSKPAGRRSRFTVVKDEEEDAS